MNEIKEYTGQLGNALLSLLPDSPFAGVLDQLSLFPPQWLSCLNWFVPVGSILKLGSLWLAAVAAHYALSALLRWAKLIGG